MIDHVTVRVRDLARSKSFYSAALAPLGYRFGHEGTFDGVAMIGFAGPDKRLDTWFVADATHPSGPAHFCWRAADRASVAAFHAAARTTAHPDYGRTITSITTALSCSIPTATMSRRSAMSARNQASQQN